MPPPSLLQFGWAFALIITDVTQLTGQTGETGFWLLVASYLNGGKTTTAKRSLATAATA
jgi:hypothetical protein